MAQGRGEEMIELPQMLYHAAHDPIVVNTKEEMQAYLSQGWSKIPIEQTEEGMLKAKIDWHLGEADRLQKLLDGLRPKPKRQKGAL